MHYSTEGFSTLSIKKRPAEGRGSVGQYCGVYRAHPQVHDHLRPGLMRWLPVAVSRLTQYMHQKLMAVPWAKKKPVGKDHVPDGLKLVKIPTLHK